MCGLPQFLPPNYMHNFDKLFWDERKHGIVKARLSPWYIPEQYSYVMARLAGLKVTNKELYDEVLYAYKKMEAIYYENLGQEYESIFEEKKPEKKPKSQSLPQNKKPKKRGRPRKE